MAYEGDGAAANNSFGIRKCCGRRGWTRTSDHLLRRQVLYPPELRARVLSQLILNYFSALDQVRLVRQYIRPRPERVHSLMAVLLPNLG
jgi:hypothetical protein